MCPVFIELTTEAFEEEFRKRTKTTSGGGRGRYSSRAGRRIARRPTRGVEVKEDTYAVIKVVQADGTELPLFDSGSPDGLTTSGYANFLLQSVVEARMEKSQIVETFGDAYIFFFGENPRFLDVTAQLINSNDFNWRAEWWANYHEYLRGTKLVELGARIYLFYDDIIVEGYMMQAVCQETAGQPYELQLQFKLFVTNYSNISFVLPPENAMYPIRQGAQYLQYLENPIDLTSGSAARDIIDAVLIDQVTQQELQQYDTISEALRQAPSSFGFPSDFWQYEVFSANAETTFGRAGIIDVDASSQQPLKLATQDIIFREGNPLRGLIAENVDEFVGTDAIAVSDLSYDNPGNRPPSAMKGTVRRQFEVDDLFRQSIEFLTCYGANINSPELCFKLGLGPNFKPKVTVEDSTTFSPIGNPEYYRNGASLNNWLYQKGEQISNSWDQFKEDPLDLVYGRPESEGSTFGPNRSKYTQGAGDPLYGYPSDFADGQPGFGIPGFGDFGGLGFGSGSGSNGDPGFKDPSKFTFAGVANKESAFERFMQVKEDNTSFSLNGTVTPAGAVTSVNGKPSSFALVSVPGILDPTGNARQRAEDIAEKQAQQKFGFSKDDPYGVNCPNPDLTLKLSVP